MIHQLMSRHIAKGIDMTAVTRRNAISTAAGVTAASLVIGQASAAITSCPVMALKPEYDRLKDETARRHSLVSEAYDSIPADVINYDLEIGTQGGPKRDPVTGAIEYERVTARTVDHVLAFHQDALHHAISYKNLEMYRTVSAQMTAQIEQVKERQDRYHRALNDSGYEALNDDWEKALRDQSKCLDRIASARATSFEGALFQLSLFQAETGDGMSAINETLSSLINNAAATLNSLATSA